MPAPKKDSLLQECTTCGALLDVSGEEPFALMHCPTCGAAMRVRQKFDHFEIQEQLGAGGMGTVYRALDVNLHRPVALKLLQDGHSQNPDFVAQFQKEAAITASINHPHVVKVYSSGQDHGRVYIAMELVDKGSLESLMHAQGKVAELQILTIGVQIAQGLQAALDKGLIHRDIKPGNILFANAATAKMVDFGLAVLAEHAGTLAGEVWATPYYVAPEVAAGKPENARSDLYSLGATLFHAIAGKPPHDVESNSMSVLAEAKKVPVDLLKVAPDVSSATAVVLNKVLNADPQLRPQTYSEFIEGLEFARTELLAALAAAEKAAGEREQAASRDWGWLTPIVALGVVALGLGGFQFRHVLFPPPVVEVAEEPPTAERIDARYEAARQLLIAGDAAKAAEAFAELDAKTEAPQPLRNWITLHAGLAELIAGRPEAALAHFATLEQRGIYSPDPAEQDLAKFFVETARKAASAQPIAAAALGAIDRDSYESIALFVCAVRDWSLGEHDESWQLFRQFSLCTPQGRHAWVSEYKPLASPYLVEINAFRGASESARSASTLETRRRALQIVKDTRSQLRLTSSFPAELDALAHSLQSAITIEEEEAARRMSATETADAKTLAEARAKIAPMRSQFRPSDALAILRTVQVEGEKGQQERAAMIKRLEWLAKFKATLIADLNTVGYPSSLLKRSGAQVPGPIRKASELQIETITPFGSLPTPWTELPPESVLAMAKSFLRPELPPETLADRQWLLGVYALQAGRLAEGQEWLVQASQAKTEYREALSLVLGSTDAP